MPNFKVHQKYTSSLDLDRNWTYSPGQYFKFDIASFRDAPGGCQLVALGQAEIKFLLKCTTLAKFKRNWAKPGVEILESEWDEISQFVDQTEFCLMAGCDLAALITEMQAISTAATDIVTALGQLRTAVELTGPGPIVDELAELRADMSAALGQIRTAIELSGGNDLEDDLAAVWGKLADVAQILGAAASEPPDPL